MKKSIFLGLLLSVGGVLASESASKAESNMMDDAQKLYKKGNKFVESLQEQAKNAPFKASPTEPGVCLFAGRQSNKYNFPECKDKTGDDLRKCCIKRKNDSIDAGQIITSFGDEPDWMKNDSTFKSAPTFWKS